jgi:hypothetical protein
MPQPSSSIGWSARWQQTQTAAPEKSRFRLCDTEISTVSSDTRSMTNSFIAPAP